MNEQELKRGKIYNLVLSIFRFLMVAFFAYESLGEAIANSMDTVTLVKLVVLILYVFGMGLMPINRTSLYLETFVVAALMVFMSTPSMISLFVFPLTTSIISRVSKLDMFIVPGLLLGMIFYGYGWSTVTFGFSLGLFAFFFIKEFEYTHKANEIKGLAIQSSKKEEAIRELESEVITREKENESLMEVFIRTKSLNEKIDIEELINELLEAPKDFFYAEYVALYVLDGDRYRLLKNAGDSNRFNSPKVIRLTEGEEPVITNKHIRVPIKLDKKSWGVLDVFGRREEVMNGQKISTNFTDDDYATIATYIGQVMFSMKHAKLLLKMEEMAKTDTLTKLANRRYFEQQFDFLLKQAKRGYDLALIMLDIDHFKQFNDTYGHEKGDEALIVVAEVLQTYVREMDFVARTGGEEFSILVPNSNDMVFEIAERLRKKVSVVPFVRQITFSMGIAYYGEDGTTMDELIRNADKALYMAKENGRNQVIEYKNGVNRD